MKKLPESPCSRCPKDKNCNKPGGCAAWGDWVRTVWPRVTAELWRQAGRHGRV